MQVIKAIPGFPGYMISDTGRLFSLRKSGPSNDLSSSLRELKGRVDEKGYRQFTLRSGNRTHYVRAHILVLTTFVRSPVAGEMCRHLDGNRQNNDLSNLAWGTAKENGEDMVRHGHAVFGERNHKTNFSQLQVDQIRLARVHGARVTDLAALYGVHISTISKICKGQRWSTTPAS